MGRRTVNNNDRARRMLAQEAARIIVEQGIQDFRVAKTKAAERLGLKDRGSLPGNSEIEAAVGEHLELFGRESHFDLLQMLRRAALSAMEILSPFRSSTGRAGTEWHCRGSFVGQPARICGHA